MGSAGTHNGRLAAFLFTARRQLPPAIKQTGFTRNNLSDAHSGRCSKKEQSHFENSMARMAQFVFGKNYRLCQMQKLKPLQRLNAIAVLAVSVQSYGLRKLENLPSSFGPNTSLQQAVRVNAGRLRSHCVAHRICRICRQFRATSVVRRSNAGQFTANRGGSRFQGKP